MPSRPRRHPKARSQKPLPPLVAPEPIVVARCIGCSFDAKLGPSNLKDGFPTCPHCGQPMLPSSAELATC